MRLRDHPLMSHRRGSNWPPVWTKVTENGTKTVRGEVGVLKFVHANAQLSNKCFLVIEHEREKFVGCLIFDDLQFCAQISMLLRSQSGRSIQEIGDLDISHML
jgi:hypothetical protein